MLVSKAKWDFIKQPQESIELSNYSPIISKLLIQRDITTEEEANRFLSPDLSTLNSPFDLSMMDKAVERVRQAIENQERILIYGDYDADGVSSTTLLLKTLQELEADCDYYIPNRFTEGYGPNESAFREAAEQGFKLIITVDTGISSVQEAEVARELGIDLIITDHHELQEELPDAYAIINPKCSPEYPFHDLAGVGVAFKFAESLLGYFPEHLLDLVAIGTIADLVPLVDENRVLAYHGLHKLTTTTNIGLKALKRICKIEGNVTEENVGFLLGPRINAVGRLQDAQLAVELLMTEDQYEAEEIASMIESINEERKQMVRDIVEEAEQMITPDDSDVIVVAKEGWSEGVLGIVASQLVRKYDRPAIVLTIKPETDEVKGSGRSIPAFNLFTNCMEIRHLFTKFGGHSQAAGMTLPMENLADVRSELNRLISEQLIEEDFKQIIEVSQTINITDITEDLIDEINQLAPFGMSNPKPVFHLKEIPTDLKQIGSLKNHLKLQFKQGETLLDGIGFGIGNLFPYISPQTPLSIVGELSINEWNGMKKPQIIIQDMRIDEWQLFDHRGKTNLNLLQYLINDQSAIVICNETINIPENMLDQVSQITYETDLDTLQEVDSLFIYQLPTDLNTLSKIVYQTKPKNIHVCFYVENSIYLKPFPSREDFKWFYSIIFKQKSLNLEKEITNIMNVKKWPKERIIFIVRVFEELKFIMIDNGIIRLNPHPEKRDLQESKLYQDRLNQGEIEKVLYYSNYGALKNWFQSCMDSIESPEEEVMYGL